jgi:multiple sugar transport system substrate-binding protein
MANLGSTRRRLLAGIALTPALPLAACGQTSGGGGDQAGRATEAQPATVQFYFGTAGAPEIQLYTTLKEGFERQNPRYTLELLPAENETEKALTLMAAGTPPDVYWNRVRASQVFIRRDALVDVLPLMKRDKLSQDDFWPSAVRAYTYKGGYFGLPTSASSNAVYFNALHFRAVGLPLPTELEKQGRWTWDALVDTARRLTRTDGGKKSWGFKRPSGLTLTVQYMWQNGGTPFSEDRAQSLLTSPEVLAAEQWLADLSLRHQVSPPVGDPEDADNGYRVNGTLAMEQSGRYAMPGIVQGAQAGTVEPGMVVAPKGPKKDTTRGDDLAASILRTSKVVEAAWAYARYWASEEGQLVVLKSNRSYTSRRSIARNAGVLKQVLNPWEDGEAYFAGLQRGEVFPVTPKFVPQVRDTFDREERLAHAGTKTVRDAMQTAHTEIAPLLKEPF